MFSTMSVAQATVTQKVSHLPVMPKYGLEERNMFAIVNPYPLKQEIWFFYLCRPTH